MQTTGQLFNLTVPQEERASVGNEDCQIGKLALFPWVSHWKITGKTRQRGITCGWLQDLQATWATCEHGQSAKLYETVKYP
jgi:hypothetical protein